MQKISVKRLSILGAVLMAASAVTAAILPNKTDKDGMQAAGSLTQNGTSRLTCTVSDGVLGDPASACNASTAQGSSTTGVGNNSVADSGGPGLNTTIGG